MAQTWPCRSSLCPRKHTDRLDQAQSHYEFVTHIITHNTLHPSITRTANKPELDSAQLVNERLAPSCQVSAMSAASAPSGPHLLFRVHLRIATRLPTNVHGRLYVQLCRAHQAERLCAFPL